MKLTWKQVECADYMKWLLELDRIGTDALAAIRKALREEAANV